MKTEKQIRKYSVKSANAMAMNPYYNGIDNNGNQDYFNWKNFEANRKQYKTGIPDGEYSADKCTIVNDILYYIETEYGLTSTKIGCMVILM